MSEKPLILDYGSRSRRRSTELLLKSVDFAWWLLFYRRVRAAEVAIGAWLAWVGLFTFWAMRRFEFGSDSLKLALSLTILLPCAVGIALVRLVQQRRWRSLLLFGLVAVAVAPLSGMLQFERCPHATYVQVLGISIAIEGDRCGNPRKVEPWWWRE